MCRKDHTKAQRTQRQIRRTVFRTGKDRTARIFIPENHLTLILTWYATFISDGKQKLFFRSIHNKYPAKNFPGFFPEKTAFTDRGWTRMNADESAADRHLRLSAFICGSSYANTWKYMARYLELFLNKYWLKKNKWLKALKPKKTYLGTTLMNLCLSCPYKISAVHNFGSDGLAYLAGTARIYPPDRADCKLPKLHKVFIYLFFCFARILFICFSASPGFHDVGHSHQKDTQSCHINRIWVRIEKTGQENSKSNTKDGSYYKNIKFAHNNNPIVICMLA